jgi:protein-ribulosamine 3-kinase
MMQLPDSVYDGSLDLLQKYLGKTVVVKGFSFSGGGCINHGGRLETNEGAFFLKWNDANRFPGMFEAEAKGLELLQKPGALFIPNVIGVSERQNYQFLLLDFVDQKQRSGNYWNNLGEQLATLHGISSKTYGLDHNNYIGSLHQYNDQKSSWTDFFIHQRLEVQLKLAESSGSADTRLRKRFDELYKKLPSLLPDENPALVHGDLWSGNLMVNNKGEPCLIDPAVYFGHREVDLAMSKLFGGFAQEFYEKYNDVFPLSPGYQKRFDLYNLYPLLVHVNLFGGAYINQVNSILQYYL